jgi:hypothetical protein
MKTGYVSRAVWCALGCIALGCGSSVDVRPAGDTGAATGAGAGVSTGAASSGGGGSAAWCEASAGHCISLDLPACPAGFVSAFFESACDDPQQAGQSQCCLPAADTCADAAPVDISSGTLTVRGDTSSAVDEHPSLTCDSPHVGFSFDQGQFYFRFQAKAATEYQLVLTSSFYGFVYVFPASVGCSFDAIEYACSSDGATGMVSGIVNPGSSVTSVFFAPVAAEYIFAVDGDTSPGIFELTITEQ